jgi:dienelactone hydrolase
VALTVFPTQTITDDSVAIAAHIAEQSYALAGPITCTPSEAEEWRECTGAFVASDYRGVDGVVRRAPGDGVVPSRTYSVPFVVWLPTHDGSLAPPYETIVFGHGLGGTRFQARQLARFAAPRGIATVAIDAVQHGEHPTVPEGASTDTLATVLRFFGVDLAGDDLLDALLLRDHWRQSTYDKLQLARLLEDGLDVDTSVPGVDIDAERLAYLGVSLGGIMGPELAALTDRFGAVLLVVPGGRVSSIVSESEQFGPLIPLLGAGRPAGDVFRFFPVLQTILDRGDAASYGPHVLADRLTGSSVPPSVLVGVVLDDDTVPNVSNYTLVRALGTPVVPPVRRPFEGMVVADSAPFSGNLAGGAATAGALQLDWVGDGEGGARIATHSNVGASDVGAEAWLQFLVSHWDDGLAVIVDPYETLGFPRPD